MPRMLIIYRRRTSAHTTIFARDEYGRRWIFRYDSISRRAFIVRRPMGLPLYNRIDFANRFRFAGRVRSQTVLAQQFADATHEIDTGWFDLPENRSRTRRTSNQGMNHPMNTLTGANKSATEYAKWFNSLHPGVVNSNVRWEWCHLQAHSMGGNDDEDNVVAAVKGNNSEQLVIENTLTRFAREGVLELRVIAAVMGSNHGKHLGNVICYKIRCPRVPGNKVLSIYLDCLRAPRPSEIHYTRLRRIIVSWVLRQLRQVTQPVSRDEEMAVQANFQ